MHWVTTLLLLALGSGCFCIGGHYRRTRQVNPLTCHTNIGRKGSCVDRNRCKGQPSSSSPQCLSPTGRDVVCCEGFNTRPVVIPNTCGIDGSINFFIIGGKESQLNAWPWMVAIYEGKEFLCGGSVINSRYILTAAHCFVESLPKPEPRKYFVRLGEFDLTIDIDDELTQDSALIAIKIHPNYSHPSAANDIALLQLPYSVGFQPVCLPEANTVSNSFADVKATVTGWGTLKHDGEQANRLQEVSIPLVTNSQCDEQYKTLGDYHLAFPNGVNKKFLCAGVKEGGKDACQGDSGGPLVIKQNNGRWTQIGIVSTGYQCGSPGFPGVYTRITEFLPWIRLHSR